MQKCEFETALQYTDKILNLEPGLRGIYEMKGWLYLFNKDYSKAIEMFENYSSMVVNPLKGITGLGFTHALMGNREKAKEYLNKILERQKTSNDIMLDIDIAIVYSGLKEMDKVFQHLERAFEQKHGILFVHSHPGWKIVRKDPRYTKLIAKVGFIE